jgi:hypothetical protein
MSDEQASDKSALVDLNVRIAEAEKGRDAAFLRTVLSDSLRFRRANGTIVERPTFLDDLLNPTNTFERLDIEDVEVSIFEGVAIVTLIVRAKGTREGKPFEGVFRNLRTFLKEPDQRPSWKLHFWYNVRVDDTKQ